MRVNYSHRRKMSMSWRNTWVYVLMGSLNPSLDWWERAHKWACPNEVLDYHDQGRNLQTSWEKNQLPIKGARAGGESSLSGTSRLLHNYLQLCCKKCDPLTGSCCVHWEPHRNAESQAPAQSSWIQIHILIRPLVTSRHIGGEDSKEHLQTF